MSKYGSLTIHTIEETKQNHGAWKQDNKRERRGKYVAKEKMCITAYVISIQLSINR